MKKSITRNILLSGFISTLLVLTQVFLSVQIPTIYYVAVLFYFITYLTQILLIEFVKHNNHKFVLVYNLTTFLKMILALLFLIIYYLFLSDRNDVSGNMYFSIFFITTYLIYLVFNLGSFLKQR